VWCSGIFFKIFAPQKYVKKLYQKMKRKYFLITRQIYKVKLGENQVFYQAINKNLFGILICPGIFFIFGLLVPYF